VKRKAPGVFVEAARARSGECVIRRDAEVHQILDTQSAEPDVRAVE